ISVHSVPEGQHNFILGAGRVPEIDEAIEQMGQWLRSRLWSVKGAQLEAYNGNYDVALKTFAYEKEIQMSEVNIATATPETMVAAVISHLNKGEIDDTLALFADQFSFKDHGIGLEFNAKDRLAKFFRKARELYTDTLVRTETIFVSGSNVLTE